MKITVEAECTPEEARTFLGLPDVGPANEIYVEAMTKAMRGVTSIEGLQEYARQLAPMGQAGLKLFQQVFEKSAGAAMSGLSAAAARATRHDPPRTDAPE